MARKTKEAAAATREALLEAAVTLFLRKGVSSSTLEDIAREAGMTRGAVYHHFANKADLLRELLASVKMPAEQMFADLQGHVKGNSLEALQKHIELHFGHTIEDAWKRRVYKVLFHRCEWIEEISPAFKHEDAQACEFHTRLSKLLQECQDAGQMRSDISPHYAAFALYSFYMGVYSNMLRPPWEDEIDELPYEKLLDIFFSGLRAK